MVRSESGASSYWHHVGLFYKQMEGLARGRCSSIRSTNLTSISSNLPVFWHKISGYQLQNNIREGGDRLASLTAHEIHMINFLPDFWDMIEAFHLVEASGWQFNGLFCKKNGPKNSPKRNGI